MKKTKLYSEIGNMKSNHILYLIKLTNDTESFCKIGVTSKTIEDRMSWVENYDYEIISTITSDGYKIRGLESILKEQILDFNKHYQPKSKIAGYTECYDVDYIPTIKSAFTYIEKTLNKKEIKIEPTMAKIDKTNLSYLGQEFQIKLLANILKDKSFGEEILPMLSPLYFNNDNTLKTIAASIYEWWSEHDEIIDLATLILSFDLTTFDGRLCFSIMKKINAVDINLDIFVIREKALNFCRYQELKKSINYIQKILNEDNLEDLIVCENILIKQLEYSKYKTFNQYDFEKIAKGFSENRLPFSCLKIDEVAKGFHNDELEDIEKTYGNNLLFKLEKYIIFKYKRKN